ncbi:MAG: hypothetical protein CL428_10850 [Acidimicrobiaceae bacterium]|nr:hypothetical protein [Acidimicrobiaceae bacterium]
MSNYKKFSFYLIIFIIFFILFEIVFNLLKIRPSNSNYGWLNTHQYYNYIIKDITKNKFGTRDTFDKDPDKENIILLGDSQVETAQKEKNMPARILEKHLNNKYNVYSFGSWGWGTDQQLLMLEKNIENIKPKFVIVFFTPNDLTDNYHNIGFFGEKPTFKLNDKNELITPKFENYKKLLNNFWTYRIFFRLKLFYQNRNLENFLVEDYFQKRNNCNFNQEISIKNLIEERINYNWYLSKYKEVYSNNPNQSSDEERIKISYYRFFDKRNNYELETDREYDYFRDHRTDLENKKINLTNRLLKKIQKISNQNKSKMFLINVINFNYLFEEEKDYKICINNKEVIYSNENYFKTFNDTFNGINNIINFEIYRGTIDYDIYDAHLNFEMNNKLFKRVSNYIN